MSIKAMTWAFGLPLEPRAKIALLAIADNARDDGIAWPSKDTIAEKSSQSRATVQRKLKRLEQLGVLACFSRYREDGTQTSDEIRLNLAVTSDDVLLKMHDSDEVDGDENDHETGTDEASESTGSDRGGGCQPDTLPSHYSNPTVALVTRGGLHCGNPQDEPSLEPRSLPNPSRPERGSVSKSDQVKEAEQAEPEHFEAFFTACLGWRTMPRDLALTAFRFLTLDEQGRARAASPLHADECTKFKRRSKDAHKLIRERFWERYPNARLAEKPPDPVWIEEGPKIDALRTLYRIANLGEPKLINDDVRGSGLLRRMPLTDDLRALSAFAGDDELDWLVAEPDSREFNAWRHRLHDWLGVWVEPRIVMRRGRKSIARLPGQEPMEVQNRQHGIPVPCRWPPKKDGTIYADGAIEEGNAA